MTAATRRCLRGLINLGITAEKEAEAATLLAPLPDPRPLIFCVGRGDSRSPTGAARTSAGLFPFAACVAPAIGSDLGFAAASIRVGCSCRLVRARRIWA